MKVTLKRTAPNYRQKLSTIRIMQDLMIGVLVLAIISVILNFVNFGNDYGVKAITIFATAVIVGLVTDGVCGKLFKRNDKGDNKYLNVILSPVVTSVIFALTLPVGTPLYVVGVGAFIAILFGKAIYGGFGSNVFNPALVGRVVVHLSFGAKLVSYLPADAATDLATTATPATAWNALNWVGNLNYSLFDLFTGNYMSALGEGCTIAILIIGVVLAIRKVFDWRIPVAYLGTAAILAFVSAMVSGINPLNAVLTHLSIGGLAFGAIFMATDPVTSPTSPLGKIVFGICLGFVTMLIRFKGNYPEGVLFAILFMNMFVPLIDNMTAGRTNTRQVKQWLTIAVCLVLSVGVVGGISTGLEEPKPAKKPEKKPEPLPAYQLLEDLGGTYLMQAKGFGGDSSPMEIEVSIKDGVVTSVKVVKAPGETTGYGEDLINSGIGEMLNDSAKSFHDLVFGGSLTKEAIEGVDTSTGATFTSEGIKNAIIGAFEAAPVIKGDLYTYTMSAEGFGGASSPMKINVTINKKTSTVEKVEVIEHSGETTGYGEDLINSGIGEMLNDLAMEFNNKVLNGTMSFEEVEGIDTSTGATFTSDGIIKAIKAAIEKIQSIPTPNANGAYEVTALGFGGETSPMKLEIKVSGEKVEYVKVLEFSGETSGYGEDLINSGSGEMLNDSAQVFHDLVLGGSFNVSELDGIDTSTGATFTTDGIVKAIKKVAKLSK